MGMYFINKKKEEFIMSNSAWAYILNLGEIYGWVPLGTLNSKTKEWDGSYDSCDGQTVTKEDVLHLKQSLEKAITDKNFEKKSKILIDKLQEAIEKRMQEKLNFNILPNMNKTYINDFVIFLSDEITIN